MRVLVWPMLIIAILLILIPFRKWMKRRYAILFKLAAFAMIAVCLVYWFAPHGSGSVFSEAGIGESEGPENSATESDGTESEVPGIKLEELSTEFTETDVTITISGKEITIGDYFCESIDHFYAVLEQTDLSDKEITLADDYAVASVYHAVSDALTERGWSFTERRIEEGDE